MVLRESFSDERTVSAASTSVAATKAAWWPTQLKGTGVYATSGQTVGAARVPLENSAKPVFALPVYRDRTYGEQGKDVAQLRGTLRAPGYYSAHRCGGEGARHAVENTCEALGCPVQIIGGTGDAAANLETIGPALLDGRPSAPVVTPSEVVVRRL
ncbi:hypothetical protein [Streptomyces sp. Tue6028]|uniref:hypothetical protein n=1 Tax=Streptomyces sp. Tue6028 TaxID=2036037 RepID=UPI003D7057AF